MKYLFIINDNLGFKDDVISEITENDILISDEIYNKFFELQSEGKKFKVKDITGTTFEDIFEEVIPEIIAPSKTEEEKLKERVSALEDALLFLMDGGM